MISHALGFDPATPPYRRLPAMGPALVVSVFLIWLMASLISMQEPQVRFEPIQLMSSAPPPKPKSAAASTPQEVAVLQLRGLIDDKLPPQPKPTPEPVAPTPPTLEIKELALLDTSQLSETAEPAEELRKAVTDSMQSLTGLAGASDLGSAIGEEGAGQISTTLFVMALLSNPLTDEGTLMQFIVKIDKKGHAKVLDARIIEPVNTDKLNRDVFKDTIKQIEGWRFKPQLQNNQAVVSPSMVITEFRQQGINPRILDVQIAAADSFDQIMVSSLPE